MKVHTLFESIIDNETEFAIDNHNETNGTELNYEDLYFDLCDNGYFVDYTITE